MARVGRAAEHYRTLKLLHGGVDRKLRPITMECHRSGLEYSFRIGELEPLSPDWSLLLGEAMYNLRSALDHLAYQLHERRWRGRIPKSVSDRSQFPTFQRRPTGKKQMTDQWREIATMGARERAAIEWLQPYHGLPGDPRRSKSQIGQLRAVLRDVAKLHNVDKHRRLHLAHIATQAVYRPSFPERFGFQQHPAFRIPLEPNARVDRWTFRVAPGSGEVKPPPGVYTAVAIDPDGDRIEVISNLGGNILGVKMIIDRFADRFPPIPRLDLSWVRQTTG